MKEEWRLRIREHLTWIKVQRRRLAFWNWRLTRLPRGRDADLDVYHVGSQDGRIFAADLLAKPRDTAPPTAPARATAWITDFPMPGAFCVPRYVSTVVPLDRTLEQYLAGLDSELRRRIRKQLPITRVERATDPAQIEFAEQQMLRPYAAARRGEGAIQLGPGEVQRLARIGRLDIVYLDGEPVSCNLGTPVMRGGKRYWTALRYGFTAPVFNDRKRWGEVNALNNFMLMKWSTESGFDYYDIGYAAARPEDGLLQWKKRQGGVLGRLHNYEYSYLKVPRAYLVDTLWATPLFAIEGGGLVLHLGAPHGQDDEALFSRWKHMAFEGLRAVRLYAPSQPTDAFLGRLTKLYSSLAQMPALHVMVIPRETRISH